MPQDISIRRLGLEESVSEAVQQMFDLDLNRLTPGEDYPINVQGSKEPYWTEDKAKEPLFSYMNERELQRLTNLCWTTILPNLAKPRSSIVPKSTRVGRLFKLF